MTSLLIAEAKPNHELYLQIIANHTKFASIVAIVNEVEQKFYAA